jgi:hypothetical protein
MRFIRRIERDVLATTWYCYTMIFYMRLYKEQQKKYQETQLLHY